MTGCGWKWLRQGVGGSGYDCVGGSGYDRVWVGVVMMVWVEMVKTVWVGVIRVWMGVGKTVWVGVVMTGCGWEWLRQCGWEWLWPTLTVWVGMQDYVDEVMTRGWRSYNIFVALCLQTMFLLALVRDWLTFKTNLVVWCVWGVLMYQHNGFWLHNLCDDRSRVGLNGNTVRVMMDWMWVLGCNQLWIFNSARLCWLCSGDRKGID